MNESERIRRAVLQTGQSLYDRGLVAGTWGNVSARVPGAGLIAVTPSGRDYRTLEIPDILLVSPDGAVVEGRLKPSTELPLHLAIYRARPDLAAVVHTHSIFASACAVARRPIPPIIEDLVQVAGGSVDVAEYALPGTEALAGSVVAGLGMKRAVLLANHGVAGCGETLAEALTVCELVEKAARIFIYAAQLGGAHELSPEDTAAMHRYYLEVYRKEQGEANQ